VEIPADAVISATGNNVDSDLLRRAGIAVGSRGKAAVDGETFETALPGVYIIGDAAGGPATVAEAIANALKCAKAVAGDKADAKDTERYAGLNVNPDPKPAAEKSGILCRDCAGVHESERCLECATVCRRCVEVCPNRANIAVFADGRQQIVHIDMLCNECGNCGMFCPYSSDPYLDKFTLFACENEFGGSGNAGFLPLVDGSVRVRLDGAVSDHTDGSSLPDGIWTLIEAANDVGQLIAADGSRL